MQQDSKQIIKGLPRRILLMLLDCGLIVFCYWLAVMLRFDSGEAYQRAEILRAMAPMLWGLSYCGYNLPISLGVPLPPFWQAQSAQQVILGVASSAVVYIAVSLCTRPEYEKADAFIAAANLLGKKKSGFS